MSAVHLAAQAAALTDQQVEAMPDLYLATHQDGSQSLVTLWGDGTGELAYRPDAHSAWGAPTSLGLTR